MENTSITSTTLALTSQTRDLDIEEQMLAHLRKTNAFFRSSYLTLDDLHEYASPFRDNLQCLLSAAEGFTSKRKLHIQNDNALVEIKAIHAVMNAANDALSD